MSKKIEGKDVPENDQSTGDESSCDEDLEMLSWDGMDDRDCYMTLKTVSDVFAGNSERYYFYRVRVKLVSDVSTDGGGSCKDELAQVLSTLNGVGFVLKSSIPDEVLLVESDLFLSDVTLRMTVEAIGTQDSIPDDDLRQMQRFHRAVCCLEDVHALRVNEYLDLSTNLENTADGDFDTAPLMDAASWTASSNGAWYVLYPIDNNSNSNSSASNAGAAYDRVYVEKCANEAQVMVHNLRIVALSDTSTPTSFPVEQSCARYPPETWKDLLVLGNGISFCCAAADTPQNRKTLHDVMKWMKVDFPPPVVPALVVVPQDSSHPTIPVPPPLVVRPSSEVGPIPVVQKNFTGKVKVTYADHLKSKRPHLIETINRHMKDPEHRLLAVNQLSTKATHMLLLTPISANSRENPDWVKRNSVLLTRVERLHFLAEQCRPLGQQRWYYTSRLIPSVMHRIQSWILAFEARQVMTARIEVLNRPNDSSATQSSPSRPKVDGPFSISSTASPSSETKAIADGLLGVSLGRQIDGSAPSTPGRQQAPQLDFTHMPSLKLMLEALTPLMVNESFNSERLETLGDSFLKYVISVELFKIRPDMREGQLTSARAAYINNRKQCQVCLASGMAQYLRAIALSHGERIVNVCAPGMSAADQLAARSVWGSDIMANPVERKYRVEGMYRYPKKQHQRRTVLFKKLSDMVEAVIAAYYVHGGEEAGIAAVKAFNTWPRNALQLAGTPAPSGQGLAPPPPPVAPTSGGAGAMASYAAQMAAYNSRYGKGPSPPLGKPASSQVRAASPGVSTRPAPATATAVHNGTAFHQRFGAMFAHAAPPAPPVATTGAPGDSPSRKRPYGSASYPVQPGSWQDRLPQPPPLPLQPPPTPPASRPVAPFSPPPPLLPPPAQEADLRDLEASLRYTFKDKELLRLALTHASVSRCANAERLEFLGDAVLDFVTVDHMFRNNVHFEPMDLHDTKSKNTCNRNLASKAYKLGLHKFLQHKSEHLQAQLDLYCADHAALRPSPVPVEMGTAPIGAPLSSSLLAGVAVKDGKVVGDVDSTSDVLADTLEAIIGAIFLDCGEDTAVIQRFAAENDLLIA